MSYSQSISLASPNDGAEGVALNTSLAWNYTGDLLPRELWLDGELKFSAPQGAEWYSSLTPTQLGLEGGFWQQGITYSWYIRYANYAETKTWNGEEWEFTGLVYTTTATRTFTTGIVNKVSPTHGSVVTPSEEVILDWTDSGVGVSKYGWSVNYEDPIWGASLFSGTITPPTTLKDVSAYIEMIADSGATQCTWKIRPYIGEYLDDHEGAWTIYFPAAYPNKATIIFPQHQEHHLHTTDIPRLRWNVEE